MLYSQRPCSMCIELVPWNIENILWPWNVFCGHRTCPMNQHVLRTEHLRVKCLKRHSVQAIERSIERASDRVTERPNERVTERPIGRAATERPKDRAIERPSVRAPERSSDDRASDRASYRAIDGDRKSTCRQSFDTLTSAMCRASYASARAMER